MTGSVAPPIRWALDENFPPIVLDVASALPEIELAPLRRIDRRLLGLPDRRMIIALHQLGWSGLITNNHKMLRVPTEIAAIVRTRMTMIAVEGVGDDPLRATGVLMTDLPAIVRRLRAEGHLAHVFLRRPSAPRPEPSWEHFRKAAERRHRDVGELYDEVKVTDDELAAPVLD